MLFSSHAELISTGQSSHYNTATLHEVGYWTMTLTLCAFYILYGLALPYARMTYFCPLLTSLRLKPVSYFIVIFGSLGQKCGLETWSWRVYTGNLLHFTVKLGHHLDDTGIFTSMNLKLPFKTKGQWRFRTARVKFISVTFCNRISHGLGDFYIRGFEMNHKGHLKVESQYIAY